MKSKYEYKLALKHAKNTPDIEKAEKINASLAQTNPSAFWKCWNANYNSTSKTRASPIIQNLSDHVEIANAFKNHFSNIYVNSSDDDGAVKEFHHLYHKLSLNSNPPLSVEIQDIENAIKHLNLNKSADAEHIMAEYTLYSHPSIILHLKNLFKIMLHHSYVPQSFTSGIITPIIKDKRGDPTSIDNYRPITISSTISKIFEYFLLDKFTPMLSSDLLQFAYKPRTGCPDAIFLLRQVIQHFNNKSSTVYIASLDASKAFDRVNHFKLLSTLIKKGLPKCFIDIIYNWYTRLSVLVKWNNSFSSILQVHSGVRQGGVLSGLFFNCYVNPFITSLRQSDLGCHIKNCYAGCIMYADDLILLSASVIDLQNMLNICDRVGHELGINFNVIKSKCLAIGPLANNSLSNISIGNINLQCVNELDYLGVCLRSAKFFLVDLSNVRRKFFASLNSIMSKCRFTSDLVKLKLLESHCLPILLYAVESLNLPFSQITEMNSWWNSIYRKIFNYQKWESVKLLIYMLGRLDLHHIINFKTLKFTVKI